MVQSLERKFDDEAIADVSKRKNKPKKHASELTHADIVNSAPLVSKSFESMLSPACRPIASMVSEDAGIAGSIGGTAKTVPGGDVPGEDTGGLKNGGGM